MMYSKTLSYIQDIRTLCTQRQASATAWGGGSVTSQTVRGFCGWLNVLGFV